MLCFIYLYVCIYGTVLPCVYWGLFCIVSYINIWSGPSDMIRYGVDGAICADKLIAYLHTDQVPNLLNELRKERFKYPYKCYFSRESIFI